MRSKILLKSSITTSSSTDKSTGNTSCSTVLNAIRISSDWDDWITCWSIFFVMLRERSLAAVADVSSHITVVPNCSSLDTTYGFTTNVWLERWHALRLWLFFDRKILFMRIRGMRSLFDDFRTYAQTFCLRWCGIHFLLVKRERNDRYRGLFTVISFSRL